MKQQLLKQFPVAVAYDAVYYSGLSIHELNDEFVFGTDQEGNLFYHKLFYTLKEGEPYFRHGNRRYYLHGFMRINL